MYRGLHITLGFHAISPNFIVNMREVRHFQTNALAHEGLNPELAPKIGFFSLQ